MTQYPLTSKDILTENITIEQKTYTLAEYMELALFTSHSAYYEQEQSLGADFVTPSITSDAFNDSIATWALAQEHNTVVEYGAGLGLTANSLLKKNPQLIYKIIEKSEQLKTYQKDTLNYNNLSWVDSLLETKNALVILQEVFDCLPARWFIGQDGLYKEKLIHTESYERIERTVEKEILPPRLKHLPHPFQWFFSEIAGKLLTEIYTKIDKSTVLIIDYGFRTQEMLYANRLVLSPLRAYQKHQQHEQFWSHPGSFDLTYDVDFDYLMETWVQLGGLITFYGTLASFLIEQTDYLDRNCPKAKIFLDNRHMGEVFKVLVMKKSLL